MNLVNLYNLHILEGKSFTDKGSVHCYIQKFYNDEFLGKENDYLKIVEIGAACGQSLILWRDYFKNADIYSFDINPCGDLMLEVEGVKVIYKDAYIDDNVNMFDDESLDYVIDDGPHNFDSQMACIEKWFSKLKNNGTLIIEDIPHIDFTKHFIDLVTRKNFNCTYLVHDFTDVNGRFDDIMFILRKLPNE